MERKILVHRKGYHRRGFYIHRNGKRIYIPPTYIPPTTYYRKDTGEPGKTTDPEKLWFHPKRKMKYKHLEWHKDYDPEYRHIVLGALVKRRGYACVVRELNALRNVTTDPATKKACEEDLKWLKETYRGGE